MTEQELIEYQEFNQEEICSYCEESTKYQCQGSHCKQATEAYIEHISADDPDYEPDYDYEEATEEEDVEETVVMSQDDLEELEGLMDDILNK